MTDFDLRIGAELSNIDEHVDRLVDLLVTGGFEIISQSGVYLDRRKGSRSGRVYLRIRDKLEVD